MSGNFYLYFRGPMCGELLDIIHSVPWLSNCKFLRIRVPYPFVYVWKSRMRGAGFRLWPDWFGLDGSQVTDHLDVAAAETHHGTGHAAAGMGNCHFNVSRVGWDVSDSAVRL